MTKLSATFHIDELEELLNQKEYEQAASYLIQHSRNRVAGEYIEQWCAFFEQFPISLLAENLDLRLAQAKFYVQGERKTEAIHILERLRFHYQYSLNLYEKAMVCCLELVRIFISSEKFRTALHYVHEVAPLIERGLIHDSALKARYFLRCAEVYTDLGFLQEDFAYSSRAYLAFCEIGDVEGQFQALLRQVFSLTQVARYADATSKLEVALACHEAADLGLEAKARLLNFQLHLHWYRGKLEQALAEANRYHLLVEQENLGNFRVYAQILLANIHRALGHYVEADRDYHATRHLAEFLHFSLFLPWVDAQSAWLRLLQGRYDDARHLIQHSLAHADLGQAMSFQITLAVIELVTGEAGLAQRLLCESLIFYQKSGDELTICVIHLYLALSAKQQAQSSATYAYLQQSLQWLAERHIDYFPHWWHPQILADLFTLALQLELYPDVAERILLQRLRQEAIQPLKKLLASELPSLRTKAATLLRIIVGTHLHDMPMGDEPVVKQVIDALLTTRQLRADGYLRLCQELTTAKRRTTPNLTIVAVFGLFVHGAHRDEIAQLLHCTIANVRNYITIIYDHFGVPYDRFVSASERHARLLEIARERGFV